MNKKAILNKTAQVGSLTLLSRLLGVVREIVWLRFFGLGVLSDAFLTAFKLPNFMRKIFAEGALSAAFIPPFVKMVHDKELEKANSLMTLSFLFFEGILLVLCVIVILIPGTVISLMAPGFSPEQVAYTIPLLQILFPLIFFFSTTSLLAGALQSVHHFFVPALGQPVLNVIWILSTVICLYFGFSAKVLGVGMLFGGLAQLLMHFVIYFRKGFSFGPINKESIAAFKGVLRTFLPCFLGASVMEVNLFLDTAIASYLPKGSTSMIYYGNRFMQIPLSMFAIAFSTVLLPHFSKVVLYAPRRMSFYLLEVAKFVAWVIIPATVILIFDAHQIFSTFLTGGKTTSTAEDITTATWVLIIFALGLIFFCINKILTNIFYAYKDTWTPSVGFMVSTVVNLIGNLLGMYFWGIYGIVWSTVISAIVLTVFFIVALSKRHNVVFYGQRLGNSLVWIGAQGLAASIIFILLRNGIFFLLSKSSWYSFLYQQWGYWLIEAPLVGMFLLFLVMTRKRFNIKMHFMDH